MKKLLYPIGFLLLLLATAIWMRPQHANGHAAGQQQEANPLPVDSLSKIKEGGAAWHCTLQSHLTYLLREEKYNLYDAEGEARDPRILFADEGLFGDVYYYDAYTAFWPDYEEICHQADFDIVMLGGLDKQIYGIDWQAKEISLYSTFSDYSEDKQQNWLKKGSLRYRIVPDNPQPKPAINSDLFQ